MRLLSQKPFARGFLVMLFCITLQSFNSLMAQSPVTTGIVKDADGKPVAGATINKNGTTVSTVSKDDGSFTINATTGDELNISYVGYQNHRVKVGKDHLINVQLAAKTSDLNDVVVVGYGSQKKKDLTGSVAVVNVANAKKTISYDVAKILQGQAAGVEVQGSGEPGGYVNVKIRGITTFQNNAPLYVIDGVLVDQPYDFPVDDIETIQILKDASAGAIFGARGATGVVIITTKKGAAGALKVNFNTLYGWQNITKKIPLTGRTDYQKITSAAEINAGLAVAPGNDPTNPAYISNVNTDWQDADFKTGNITDNSIRLSGGGENTSFNAGLDYFGQTSTLAGPQDYKRYAANASLQGQKGIFSFGVRLAYTYSHKVNNTYPHLHPNVGNAVTNLLIDIPTMPVYDTTREGGYGGTDNVIQKAICINPIGMNNLITDYSNRNRLLANAWAQVQIVKGLNYKLSASYDNLDYTNFYFEPTYDLGWYYTNNIAYMSQQTGNNHTYIIDNTLDYQLKFGKSTLGALAGITYQETDQSWTTGSAQGFTKPYFYTFNAASSAYPKSLSESLTTLTIASFIGRLNYNYDGRYLLTVNFRRDGSSNFSPTYRYGNFGSIAGAWVLSSEKFMELPKFINFLKLRGGYGTLGNQNIGSYLYQPVVNSNASYLFGTTPVLAPGTTSTAVVDSKIKWESKVTANAALDMTMLDNRLSFTVEWYSNKSNDLLAPIPIPLSVGSTGGAIPNSVVTNAASVKNEGFEFTVGYKNSIGEVNYNISANASTLKNTVTALGGTNNPIYGIGSKTAIGHSVGELFGFQTEGLFQSQADIDKHATQTGAAPGDVKFKNTNGDNIITDDDRVYLGSAIPTFYYGFNVDLNYKSFDFSFFFQGSGGNKVFNGVYASLMAGQYTNHSTDELNYWTPANTNTNVPRPVIYDPNGNARFSDRFVESGNYMKLQNLVIGYTLSNKTLTSVKFVRSLRIYASGQNLVTFSNYKGYDPDFISDGLFSRGYDYGSFPNPRTVLVGLQVGF
jgi:TonB-dependent starch-binding outer membrane protein SusC